MNKNSSDASLVQLLIATPLLLLATSISAALLIALVFLFIAITAMVIQAWLPSGKNLSLRTTLALMSAATAAALADIFLRAFAWQFHPSLHAYLPVAAISAYGFAGCGYDRGSTTHAKGSYLVCATCVIIGIGTVREFVGTGALFNQLELLFAAESAPWRTGTGSVDRGWLLALLPCATLIGIGLLIALKNRLQPKSEKPPTSNTKMRRVRVTGPIS